MVEPGVTRPLAPGPGRSQPATRKTVQRSLPGGRTQTSLSETGCLRPRNGNRRIIRPQTKAKKKAFRHPKNCDSGQGVQPAGHGAHLARSNKKISVQTPTCTRNERAVEELPGRFSDQTPGPETRTETVSQRTAAAKSPRRRP
jgi:hypothetical protein